MLLHDVKSQQHIFLYELVYFLAVNVFLTCCARADTPPKTAPNRGPFVPERYIFHGLKVLSQLIVKSYLFIKIDHRPTGPK
jgi:hypothetical protein